MNAVRSRLHGPAAGAAGDTGLSMVEVLVALMIFAIIAVGAAFSLTSVLTMTKDARSREIATNLAAQDIDLARSISDVSTLGNATKDFTVNGTVYHLVRKTSWVLSGNSTGCGTGGGTLQYKQSNVSVTWDGMNPATPPVVANTVISPASRINDPTLGTLIVSVLSAAGTGNSGITVTATPTAVAGNTARALTVVPGPTDADGCSYILKVTPGSYDVTVSRTNYVSDSEDLGSQTKTTGVAAGSSASIGFQFDLAGNFSTSYATNYTASTPLLPTNLDTTYINTFKTWVTTAPTSNPAQLHPYTVGYQVIAGRYIATSAGPSSCLSVDPAAWTTVAADGATGQRQPAVTAAPGGTASVGVNMGVVSLSGVSSGSYVTAVSQASAPGTDDPGCAQTMTYTFPKVGGSVLALPFGSWQLYSGTSSGAKTTALTAANAQALTRGSISTTGIITLDPRVVVP